MTLEEALKTNDLNDIFDRMLLYANARLKTVPIKNLNGKEAHDFVSEVFLKVLDGNRKWDENKSILNEFLFGSLRSHISNFFNASTVIDDIEVYEIDKADPTIDISDYIKKAISILSSNAADEMEILLFECWAENMFKPAEIAKFLEIDVKEVYVVTKRLLRKMPILQAHILTIL